MKPLLESEVNAASDSICPTAQSTLQRMMKTVEIPEDLAVRLECWAVQHKMEFDPALELAVLTLFEQSHHSPSPSISVFSPERPQ
jgi:hypothetical protein